MSVLRNSSVLVTGGTGSLGRAFARHLLAHHEPDRIVVFSRDEQKQYEMRQEFGADDRVRWVLGDIRDRDSVIRAMRGVDHVVHAAALKQVDTAEYHPFEFAKTNIEGSQNVLEAAVECGVRKVVALSTDKASSPTNLYGATKMVADKLFTSANAWASERGVLFSVVRFGNVMGSRGSVLPLFRRLVAEGSTLPITDKRMTRFWITPEQAVRFTVDSFATMRGGELFVPRIPSMKISDLAEAVAPGMPTYEVGMRPGEKLHEEMIAAEDSYRTLQLEDRYIVLPTVGVTGYTAAGYCLPVSLGFTYRSDTNDAWLSIDELRRMLDLEGAWSAS
ncbi:UDP-N-acetylglucosamine 4,6-dehydratase [Saccharothrix tamanrassetensis]|uniref:UDP-N-acetylglucosamine 4,6-dehydratase n=1 Tax=Saccharothrix tamanrassetensis TaxID=1051531 RepID=A0A841CC17_9PSEU|nr:UDP-N-acetylglucosamine 4,6-dehydratase (inverting) [Saccharothrix tamanrassetensis]MBB5953718.1 UDP-N-acetylglucosamine 4,6-dehydratase [Saccharothrix tamanrassetensis]